MDRRKHTRLPMELPATYSLPRLGVTRSSGRTVNMSRSGLLLRCADEIAEIAVGDEMEIVIELPAVHTRHARCIYCCGSIVRIERRPEFLAVALAIAVMEFRDASMSASGRSEPVSSFLM